MAVSSLKWIRAGSKDVEGRIRPAGRRLPICGLGNVGSSTSHNPIGFHGLLQILDRYLAVCCGLDL
jgi:hypothetical protein